MRWTDPATIHLTIRFLGEVAAERVADVSRAVRAAAAASRPLALSVEGPGAFPSPRRPRVLWLGVGGEVAPLRALADDLEARLAPLGFTPEARGFTPHLTLGRARSPRGAPALGPALAAPAGLPLPWRADALVLFESHLGSGRDGAARQVALLRAPLGAAAP